MADGHKDYSGTPLPKKLGIKEHSRVMIQAAPPGFDRLLTPLPTGVDMRSRAGLDVAVLFVSSRSELARRFPKLLRALVPNGRLWVAWPKKASKVPTDLTFETVQGMGLEAGLVDNKSASITDVFQGLQFVYRLQDRPR